MDIFGVISTYAGVLGCGNSGDGGPATAARFGAIDHIAIDSSNNLYLTDGTYNVVRKISSAGVVSTL